MSDRLRLGNLSVKQLRFVREYLVDLNGAQAAIRAGYSVKTARFQASRLLTKNNVSRAISEAYARHAEVVELTVDGALRELDRVAATPIDRDRIRAFDKVKALDVRLRHEQVMARHRTASGAGDESRSCACGRTAERQWDLTILTQEELTLFEPIVEKLELHADARQVAAPDLNEFFKDLSPEERGVVRGILERRVKARSTHHGCGPGASTH